MIEKSYGRRRFIKSLALPSGGVKPTDTALLAQENLFGRLTQSLCPNVIICSYTS